WQARAEWRAWGLDFYVVVGGEINTNGFVGAREEGGAFSRAGQFTGELNLLPGRRALVRIRATEDGEVIEIDREHGVALVQTDSELGDVLMQAFILRRLELIARGAGDVLLVGSNRGAGTLRIKECLTRHGHPPSYLN